MLEEFYRADFNKSTATAATFDYAMELEAQYSNEADYREFNSTDELSVPEVWWKIEHNFAELEKKPLLNEGFTEKMIESAYQMIDFKLDNKGVELKSEAYVDMAATSPPPGRRFVFDQPFLLFLKKRGAETPIFAMWIDNAELLVK